MWPTLLLVFPYVAPVVCVVFVYKFYKDLKKSRTLDNGMQQTILQFTGTDFHDMYFHSSSKLSPTIVCIEELLLQTFLSFIQVLE